MKPVEPRAAVGTDQAPPTLADVTAQPARIADLPPATVSALLAELAALQAALLARLATPSAPPAAQPDRLMTARAVADRLGVQSDWVYRHRKHLPFLVELPGGTPRFSEVGLERWLRIRRGT